MFHKIIKKLFYFIINVIQFIQVSLIFLSFFVLLYWVLKLANFTFAIPVEFVFESIKNITNIFYDRVVTIDQVEINFSFLVAALALLLISWLLNSLVGFIEIIEKKYDELHEAIRKKAEDIFNAELEHEILINEYKNNKVLYAIKFTSKNLNKDKFFNKDFEENMEEKTKTILEEFFEILEGNFEENGEIKNNVILLDFSIKDIDSKLECLEMLINSIVKKYKEQEIEINYLASIDIYARNEDIKAKTNNLIKLIQLGLENQILCLPTFKERYSLNQTPKYTLEGCGIYNIIQYEEVFSLKHLK